MLHGILVRNGESVQRSATQICGIQSIGRNPGPVESNPERSLAAGVQLAIAILAFSMDCSMSSNIFPAPSWKIRPISRSVRFPRCSG